MIEPGIYLDLSSSDYHADKTSFSRSALMDFDESPRRYWAKHLNPDRPPKEDTPSLIFGRAFHTLVLEPHLFDKEYIIKPDPVLLKDVGKKAYDLYKNTVEYIEKSGLQVLSHSDFERLCAMRDSLFRNERARALVGEAIYESSYFWEDEHTGLILKCRPDILHNNMYVDLKTIGNASASSYQREMALYNYHIQGAMVREGVRRLTGNKIDAVINICVEKTYPYSIGIYIIDEDALEWGKIRYKNICLEIKHAIAHNEFTDYPIQTISLPKWAK